MNSNVRVLSVVKQPLEPVPEADVPHYQTKNFSIQIKVGTRNYLVEGYPVRRWYALVVDEKMGTRREPCDPPSGPLLAEALLAAVTGRALSL